jgi:fumarate hydratase, class II
MTHYRLENDSLGEVKVPANKLWGAQTERSLHYFSISSEHIPAEMVRAFAILKKAAALTNHQFGQLDADRCLLISQVCDEILAGHHDDQFPLYVWMTGSGTQFNMNMNEVIANRCSQLAGYELGTKMPVHPNDHVNQSQSTNDAFPTAMHIATVQGIKERLIPVVEALRNTLMAKATQWQKIIKIGRTHMMDATPLTLGQEFSSYVGSLDDALSDLKGSLDKVYRLTLGGTAVGTGINAPLGFAERVADEIATLTGLPFVTSPNKFTTQGSHDALVMVHGALKTLATALFKMANDIRLLASGPRCGLGELHLPENEPGSSIMPGKVNPTQCEALSMLAIQVMANDVAVGFGNGSGLLEMNVYKPLIIHNLLQSIRLLTDGCENFRIFCVEGITANEQQIADYVGRSLMLVTALSPHIGYDNASQVAHHALAHNLTLREAAHLLGHVSLEDYDELVDPATMVNPG